MASIPENEGPSEAIKNDTATIAKTVETIQDRWVVVYFWIFSHYTCTIVNWFHVKNAKYQFSKQEKEMDLK